MNIVAYRSASRWLLDRLPLVGAIVISAAGVASIATLLAYDRAPTDTLSAYAAFSEVEDSPIEEGGEARMGVIHRSHDGLFHATLSANGQSLRCIVDTGATAVVINASDSHRLGLNNALRYNGRVHTAGGERVAAKSHLSEVTLVGHDFRHVPAIVVRDSATPCLLGQNLLARLDAAEFHGDKLILR